MTLPEKLYTQREIEKARSRGKAVGWVQGGAVVLAAGLLFSLAKWWLPVLVLAAAGYVVYKILSKPPASDEDE